MATIDERIVSMVFDNAKFEAGVAKTIATLGKLDASLKDIGKKGSWADIENAANRVTFSKPTAALGHFRDALGGMGSKAGSVFSGISQAAAKVAMSGPTKELDKLQARFGLGITPSARRAFTNLEKESHQVKLQGVTDAINEVSHKFSILRGAASVALGGIAQRAASAGANVIKSLTLTPVMEGFHNYETQINAVQTILANTGLKGKAGLGQVTGALNNLNTYANKTVYNFSEMARNIGTFTAAGVKLGPAVNSIKGIANLAAMSGSTSQQASGAMYQLSQAIAAGQVHLQDWNSVVNAGMGGKVFQNALMQTGLAMGTISKSAYSVDKATGQATISGNSFRQSIQSKPGETSWLTSKVLTTALANFTGDVSAAKLASEGFSQSQIKAIQEQAKTANNAATQIKTISQLFQALKEEVGTAWGAIFKTIFGDINNAKDLLSPLHIAMENFLTGPVYALNKVLQDWSKLGGRKTLIDALKQGVKDLGLLLKPVVQGFHDIFPPASGNSLMRATQGFANLMRELKPSHQTVEAIRSAFDGFFAVLHIGMSVVGNVIRLFGRLIGNAAPGAGAFHGWSTSIGGFLRNLDQMLTRGGGIRKFFDGLYNAVKGPIGMLQQVGHLIGGLFSGGSKDASAATKGMAQVTQAGGAASRALNQLKLDWEDFLAVLTRIKERIQPVLDEISKAFGKIGDAISSAFSHQNFSRTIATIQTGFMGGIFLALRKYVAGGIIDIAKSVEKPLKNLSLMFNQMTSTLKTMQQAVKAKLILEIAAAIGILATAVFILASLNPKNLAASMTAIAVGMGELMGAMNLMTNSMSLKGGLTKSTTSVALIGMATAVLILAEAMAKFGKLSWKEIARGTAGIAGGLIAVGDGMKAMGPGLMVKAPALIGIAIALNLIAVAVKQFAGMKWSELGKGLFGIFESLLAIAVPMMALGPELIPAAVGVAATAGALILFAGAIAAFSRIKPLSLALGLTAIFAALLEIAFAVALIPPTIAAQAVGLAILATALTGIAGAMKILASIGIWGILKSLIAMGGALVVLGTGLIFMQGTVLGTVALLGAAAALAILAPALKILGSMSLLQIVVGLVAIAGALGVLAGVGMVAWEGLFLLGSAMIPLAGSLALVAKAALWFAETFKVLATTGAKGLGIMLTGMTAFVTMVPNIAIQFAKGLVGIIEQIAIVAPKVVDAMVKIINSVLDVIVKSSPKMSIAVGSIIDMLLQVIVRDSPKLIKAGWTLIINLLKGFDDNISKVMRLGGDIVVKFLEGLAQNAGRIVRAGAHAVTLFLGAMTSRIAGVSGQGVRLVAGFLSGIARNIGRVYTAGASIIIAMISGIGKNVGRIVTTAVSIAGRFVRTLANGLVRLADVGAQAIIRLLNGMARVIRDRAPEVRRAGWNLASAMIDGILGGFGELWHKVTGKITGLAHDLPGWFRKPLGIHSPSKVFHEMGGFVAQGLADGIAEGGTGVEASVHKTLGNVTRAAQKTLPNLFAGIEKKNPVITPIIDLSHVRKGAAEIGRLTQTTPITATVSLAHASAISREKAAVDAMHEAAKMHDLGKPSVQFVQNNHSPEPLSTAEIYRRTNNQMSQIRKAVGLP